MTHMLPETYLDYSDILIKPKMGNNLNSRKEVILTREFKFKHGEVRQGLGVFNANMATVGNFAIAKQLLKGGLFATLHKHYTNQEIINFYKECETEGVSTQNLFITIGIKDGEAEVNKLKELRSMGWTQNFNVCIDAPNFYIPKALETLQMTRAEFPNSVIMCGNIASGDICLKLLEYADCLKVGIGSGSVCRTRAQTGCGTPMVSLILECADIAHSVGGHICADGGIVEIGDICKAFALNSDFVMIGGLFAGSDEAEGEVVERHYQSNEVENGACKLITKKFKEYYGMSSTYANNKFAGGMSNYKTSEGREVLIPYTGSMEKIIQDIKGGIASACTYMGASRVKYMSKCASIIKVNHQLNTIFERYEK